MRITALDEQDWLPGESNAAPPGREIALADLVQLRRRFLRSINLERDFYSTDPLDGYFPTPSALAALDRVAAGITQTYARAFSVTGPYGSGKSSFALYVCKVLAPASFGATAARRNAARLQPALSGHLFPEKRAGFWPILITGSREPLARALVRGLLQGLGRLPDEAGAHIRARLEEDQAHVIASESPSAQDVTRLFAAASELALTRGKDCRGLLVVVDEMGKFLEHAARHPLSGDLYVLQEMAEHACRSRHAPLLVMTILHQAFEEYASRLSAMQRQEWQKIQGRFADIPFGDGPEETLRLLSHAMEMPEDARTPPLRHAQAWQQDECRRLHLMPAAFSAGEFFDIAARTYPLHPLTLLLLPHIFRRFGQNERSLFSFLSAEDPHSLSMFLRENRLSPQETPWLRPHHLYDYVTATLGATLYSHATAKLWSETQEALFRLRDRAPLQTALVKTIGLLHILGEQTRILPSREVLRFALGDSDADAEAIGDALDALQRATLITYRQFKKAYRLYEGSDIDIDARLRDARMQLTGGTDAVTLAERLETNPPLVARRHSYETGTLRFFEVRCCRPDTLAAHAVSVGPTSGGLLLCLAPDASSQEQAIGTALSLTRPDVIVGVTRETDALLEAATAVECLLWVQVETPELRNDRVATREVRERLQEALTAFRAEWSRLMRPQSSEAGEGIVGEGSLWFYAGQPVALTSYRKLQALVSHACDRTFPYTPRLLNELVNRRQISSTATAARRNVLEAMITRRAERRLGIVGYPPEASIYVSVLESTGIHRETQGEAFGFGAPPPEHDPALAKAWQEIEAFLFDEMASDTSLPALNGRLQSPPYGVLDGVIPLLLCAALLCHEDEVIVYEEDRFVTDLDAATLERMIKRPSDYRLRGCRVEGERRQVVERFARGLLRGGERPTLVNVVRQLYREFNRLPDYTLKTRRLSATATALRDTVKRSKEPEQLLFNDLPLLFGCTPFRSDVADEENVSQFFAAWNAAMSAVMGAYDALLSEVEATLCEAFTVTRSADLSARSALLSHATEPRLRSFLIRVADTALPPRQWLESVAAGVVGRPAASWTDGDAERFGSLLPSLVSAFQNLELVAFDKRQVLGDEPRVGLRLAVTQDSGSESARVVVVPKSDEQKIETLSRRLLDAFQTLLADERQDLRVAVIGKVAEEILRGTHDH